MTQQIKLQQKCQQKIQFPKKNDKSPIKDNKSQSQRNWNSTITNEIVPQPVAKLKARLKSYKASIIICVSPRKKIVFDPYKNISVTQLRGCIC